MTPLLITVALLIPGQPEPSAAPTSDVERAEQTVRQARAEALRYELVQSDAPDKKFQLRDEPILKWSNPSEGALFGSVVLWTGSGRPVAVGSIYRWYGDRTEFQSELKLLAPHSIEVTRDGEPFWQAPSSDVEFHELPHLRSPAVSKSRRLQQMRDIARRFTAMLAEPNKGTTSLRLLSQPVYRYDELPDDLIDGAMFAFVQGTDPEVFLMIEAAKTAQGPVWQYAVARMNMFQLSVAIDDKEVWRAEELKWADVASRRGPYMIHLIHK